MKASRVAAQIHDKTTEPLADGVRFLGRNIRRGLLGAVHTLSTTKEVVLTEHERLEAEKAAKKETRNEVKRMADAVTENLVARHARKDEVVIESEPEVSPDFEPAS